MISLVSGVLAATQDAGLSVDSPLVLGPIAGFVFTVFVSEVVVSGKSYRREVAENERLRALVEKVVPLAENMVETSKEMVLATNEARRTMDDFLRFWDESGGTRSRR